MNNSKMEETLRALFELHIRSNPNFNEVIVQLTEIARGFDLEVSASEEIFQKIRAEHEQKLIMIDKLSNASTAKLRDNQASVWYNGHVIPGGYWEKLQVEMERSGLGHAIESIHSSTEAIVSSLAEPRVRQDKRRGIVIGNVQSGKTANYSAVIAKAVDQGYKLIIVLSGIHNNLRKQTQQRLERDLSITSSQENWYRLTSTDADFGPGAAGNATAILSNKIPALAVVKKNKTRLEYLLGFLKNATDLTKNKTPILIIDDESDQATPDSSAPGEINPTTINNLMRQIWDEVGNGTYVGYTATPFANIFSNPDDKVDELPELYPQDFIHVMPTPKDYFGAEQIFGLSTLLNEDEVDDGPNVVRAILESELIHIAPKNSKEVANFDAKVTDSLRDAIQWFIVAVAIRRLRGQERQHSSMLVHTTHRVEPHLHLQRAIQSYLKELRSEIYNDELDSLYDVFTEEIDQAAHLYDGSEDSISWPKISKEISKVIRTLDVVVDNGSVDEKLRLNYSTDKPQTVIVIGGGTLSRGLTLEGLFVSYFTRTSNTYDTLLQMGRWFGYRKGYEDLQRIWLSDGLEEDYRFLATVEAELREDISRMIHSGQAPKEIGVKVLYHPGRLQVTSRNKMKYADRISAILEGARMQTTLFDVVNHAENNLQATNLLLEALINNGYHYTSESTKRYKQKLFKDVPVRMLKAFFENYKVHESFEQTYKNAINWSFEKLPDKKWNVVVASGSVTNEKYQFGNLFVHPVRRTPLEITKEGETVINIRALMSSRDIGLDMLVEGKGTEDPSKTLTETQFLLKRRGEKEGADGNGIIVIYPISRSSKKQGQNRSDMVDALAKIDPNSSKSSESKPIIGIGFMAPLDTERVIADKRVYISVTPHFEDDEENREDESLEFTVSDNEKDYMSGAIDVG